MHHTAAVLRTTTRVSPGLHCSVWDRCMFAGERADVRRAAWTALSAGGGDWSCAARATQAAKQSAMRIMLLGRALSSWRSAEEPWPDSGTPALKGTPEDAATTYQRQVKQRQTSDGRRGPLRLDRWIDGGDRRTMQQRSPGD